MRQLRGARIDWDRFTHRLQMRRISPPILMTLLLLGAALPASASMGRLDPRPAPAAAPPSLCIFTPGNAPLPCIAQPQQGAR